MAVLIILALLATRGMTMVPRGRLQNLAEGVVGWLLGLCESVAGHRNGRKFFPLIATIFLFILVANWTALLPFFGTVGRVETAEEYIAHHTEELVHEMNAELPPGAAPHPDHYDEKHPPSHEVAEHIQAHVGDKKFAIFNGDEGSGLRAIPPGYNVVKEITAAEYWDFEHWAPRHGTVESDGKQVNLDGKTVGILVPFFRSMNTDINNPLAFAFIAMVMIETWGVQANGFFSYLSRFLTFKGGPIGFIVGILETVGEASRLVSFTFRLLGNMFAGEVLLLSFLFLLPVMTLIGVLPFILETFVGLVQAVVFAALTLVFATLASESHEHKEDHEHTGATAGH
jgi:F-type H+-transporting ATPase subunit a